MQEDVYRGDGLNLYAYCENNPVVYYDPSGYEGARYGDPKITGEDKKKLRAATPSRKIQNMVNEGLAIETLPISDKAIPGKLQTGKFEADHIVSFDNIIKMDNFDKLTYDQQKAVVNNPDNFVGLSRAANASKQNKSYEEWTHYKKGTAEEVPINKEFRDGMIEKSKKVETKLQDEIDTIAKENEIENGKC